MRSHSEVEPSASLKVAVSIKRTEIKKESEVLFANIDTDVKGLKKNVRSAKDQSFGIGTELLADFHWTENQSLFQTTILSFPLCTSLCVSGGGILLYTISHPLAPPEPFEPPKTSI